MDPPPGLLELAAPRKKEKYRIRALLPEKAETLEERRRLKRELFASGAGAGGEVSVSAAGASNRPIWDQRENRHHGGS